MASFFPYVFTEMSPYFQLFTSVYVFMIIANVITSTALTLTVVTSVNLSENLAKFVLFFRMFFVIYGHSVIVEFCILKYFIEFIWRRIPPLHPEFTITFLILSNTVISFVFTIIELFGGALVEMNRLIGQNVLSKPVPLFQSK